MQNNAVVLEFLKADWEAKRRAFETALALDISGAAFIAAPPSDPDVGEQRVLPLEPMPEPMPTRPSGFKERE
jgi:hypothetical protein